MWAYDRLGVGPLGKRERGKEGKRENKDGGGRQGACKTQLRRDDERKKEGRSELRSNLRWRCGDVIRGGRSGQERLQYARNFGWRPGRHVGEWRCGERAEQDGGLRSNTRKPGALHGWRAGNRQEGFEEQAARRDAQGVVEMAHEKNRHVAREDNAVRVEAKVRTAGRSDVGRPFWCRGTAGGVSIRRCAFWSEVKLVRHEMTPRTEG
ncbi:hypothetical protein ERJ75_001313700 [Trypanosoma vivax]|nr:hypothetical protein ERJ75_001313700 [Trypanosoma vivax]